jgi:DNA-binding transcriptional LysR family regulator
LYPSARCGNAVSSTPTRVAAPWTCSTNSCPIGVGQRAKHAIIVAIEAVIAGQGIGIFSNVLVASELASGTLVKAFDLSLPGYRFYVVRRHGHPREKIIRAFSTWLRSVK